MAPAAVVPEQPAGPAQPLPALIAEEPLAVDDAAAAFSEAQDALKEYTPEMDRVLAKGKPNAVVLVTAILNMERNADGSSAPLSDRLKEVRIELVSEELVAADGISCENVSALRARVDSCRCASCDAGISMEHCVDMCVCDAISPELRGLLPVFCFRLCICSQSLDLFVNRCVAPRCSNWRTSCATASPRSYSWSLRSTMTT